MHKIAIAVATAVISGVLAIVLWWARRSGKITKDGLDAGAQIATIAAGIVAVGALAVALVPPSAEPSPAPTFTAPLPSVPSPSPTSTGTSLATSPPSMPTAWIPQGYQLYDDFAASNALDANWWLEGQSESCDLVLDQGQLLYNCHNQTPDNLVVALRPKRYASGLLGVAATAGLDGAGEPFQLVTNWTCPAENSERAYQIELYHTAVKVQEFYPQEGWLRVDLAEKAVTPGTDHLLQMERSENTLKFFVDNEQVVPGQAVDLPPCFVLNDWALAFYVYGNGGGLRGHVSEVSIAPNLGTAPTPTTQQESWRELNLALSFCREQGKDRDS
ncbi:MAG: hypothetical protein JXA14_21445 [Anaerolineae bacterium]|nr:hypothetical protein [Anaerolineae bacterium]